MRGTNKQLKSFFFFINKHPQKKKKKFDEKKTQTRKYTLDFWLTMTYYWIHYPVTPSSFIVGN